MTTTLLAQCPSLLETGWLEASIEQAGLAAAWNTLGERETHRLEVIVDTASGPPLEVTTDLAEACGVALAGALLERQATEGRWAVRVLAWDEEIGAWILVHEWCAPHWRDARASPAR